MNRQEEEDLERQQLTTTRPSTNTINKWPTVDGPLGLSGDESVACARRYFIWGFALLPFLWAVNCFYFWPVFSNKDHFIPSYFPQIRIYVVRSAIGFTIFSLLLISWASTFIIGGERLFGPTWKNLVMYNVADQLGFTGWM